jgi:DnaA family protein
VSTTPTPQLVFELAPTEPPSFANFVTGRNVEAVAALADLAACDGTAAAMLIWGAPGAGKTHLLRACADAASARGARAIYLADPGVLLATDVDALARHALVAIDAIDEAGAQAQARLFTLFNAAAATGARFVAAARVPPAALATREDLRTRLGSCLVYEILPLSDEDKAGALAAWAGRRGLAVPDDAIRYLLAHGRRDMPSLLAALRALDRESLASRRPVTAGMVRDWLRREAGGR